MLTCSSSYVKDVEVALVAAQATMDNMKKQSPACVCEALDKAKPKDKAQASGKQKPRVEIDDDGFKIPQGTAYS